MCLIKLFGEKAMFGIVTKTGFCSLSGCECKARVAQDGSVSKTFVVFRRVSASVSRRPVASSRQPPRDSTPKFEDDLYSTHDIISSKLTVGHHFTRNLLLLPACGPLFIPGRTPDTKPSRDTKGRDTMA